MTRARKIGDGYVSKRLALMTIRVGMVAIMAVAILTLALALTACAPTETTDFRAAEAALMEAMNE